MARQATKAIGNRYFEARMKAAKFNEHLATRAGAVAYLPGVTEEMLKKYELDITRPPNVVVALMADAYNEPELRIWYCANECPLGKDCREIPEMPPERVLIRLQNAQAEMSVVASALFSILDDGVIDKEEVTQLPQLWNGLLEIRRRMDEALAMLERVQREPPTG